MTYIHLDNVTVRYPVYNASAWSLCRRLIDLGTGGRVEGRQRSTIVTALDQVSLRINEGDRIGLMGPNGAGKSTLLRTMAGVFTPDAGRVVSQGRISTIFEIGAGLDLELPGRENIRRMALMQGMTLKEVDALMPRLEELVELGSFLDLPVRTYSSGMTTRLMFAAATAASPQILLVDEFLGAGDAEFQKRASERIDAMIGAAAIFVFASHSPELLKRYCNRFFEVRRGRVRELAASEIPSE